MKIVTIGRTIGHTARCSHKFHIKCNKNLWATLEKYIYCNMLSLFSVQTLRTRDEKSGSVLKIPVSIVKTAQTGSY